MEMAELARLAAGLAVFVLAGLTILRFIVRPARPGLGPAATAAVSFMFGMAAVSLQMFFYSLVSIAFGFFVVAVPWAVLFGVSFVIAPRSSRPVRAWTKRREMLADLGPVEYVLLVVIVFQAAYAFIYPMLVPLIGWDSWAIWFLKARAFYIDGGVTSSFFHVDGSAAYAHTDYPLLVPLSVTWLYTALGAVNERAAKVIYPLQFASMLVILHHVLARIGTRRLALLFTALLSLTPLVMVHSAGLPVRIWRLYTGDFTGYADMTLAVYFLSAGAFIYLYMAFEERVFMMPAVLFLAAGAWTKNEGMTFALMGVVFLAAYTLMLRGRRHRGALTALIAPAAALAAFILPWHLFKAHHSLASGYAQGLSTTVIAANIGRIVPILKYMAGLLFTAPGLFNLVWWLYAASLALGWRRVTAAPLLALNALIFLQLAVYAFVLVISPSDLAWQMQTAFERLVLHLTPLAVFISAVNAGLLFGPPPAADAGQDPSAGL